MLHKLKTDPEVFQAVIDGRKTYEIRKNDRNFQVGDTLQLLETKFTGAEMRRKHNGAYPGEMLEGKPLEYTGREYFCEVTHLLPGPVYGLASEWCILSIFGKATPISADARTMDVALLQRKLEQSEANAGLRWPNHFAARAEGSTAAARDILQKLEIIICQDTDSELKNLIQELRGVYRVN